MLAGGHMEVGGPAVQDLHEEFGEVEGHVPVIDREGWRRALQAALMDDRMIEGPPMAPPPAPRTQPPKKDERPTPWRVEGEREPTGGDGGGIAAA